MDKGISDSKRVLELCDRALALSGDERDKYLDVACASDRQLRASVDSVLIAINAAGAFLENSEEPPLASRNLVGQQVGNYLIQERLGEGGMGSVYLAEREQEGFTQQVAIKLVHGHLLARELIRRFHAERQILAGLNHPYIAALIDGGSTPDGVPYIVMEYVKGKTIDQYCDENKLSIASRIKLIQKIALAVQAAHQNLVVHRDLKPSNVLITEDGIPKLLDFGIAKLIEPGPEHDGNTTVFGRQAMTPDFASPEQILENRVTTASDVYSLGVLAYQLLAGERPYHIQTTSHREMIQAVESLTVPRPSDRLDSVRSQATVSEVAAARSTTPERLKKSLSGDLDMILMKALHKEASRRYPSIAAFSADLTRYLEERPIEARPDSLAYRCRRFVSRNLFGVAAAAAVALALFAGLAGTTWAYLRAEDARHDADNRFGQVRALANSVMFDLFNDVQEVPGTKSSLQLIAKTAQEYLEGLSTTEAAPFAVRLDAARGFARLADILSDPALADPAQRKIAKTARENAEALFSALVIENPDSFDVWHEYGRFRTANTVDLLESENAPVAARATARLAIDALDKALALDSNSVAASVSRLSANIRLADAYRWEQDYSAARAVFNETLPGAESLATRFGDDERVLRGAADAWKVSGELYWFEDDFESAVADYRRAITYLDRIATDYPPQRNPVLAQTVDAIWSMANSLLDLGRADQSEPLYERAATLTAIRVARDPNDRDAERTLNILKGSRAAALAKLGRGEEATQMILEVTDWFTAQAALDTESPSAQRSLAVSYHMTANIFLDAGQLQESCKWYQQTLTKWYDIDETLGLSEFDADQPEILRKILTEDCPAEFKPR